MAIKLRDDETRYIVVSPELKVSVCEKYHIDEPEINEYQWQLIAVLSAKGPMTREEVCEAVQTKWTTAYDNLKKLERKGILSRINSDVKSNGRPLVFWGFK